MVGNRHARAHDKTLTNSTTNVSVSIEHVAVTRYPESRPTGVDKLLKKGCGAQ